LSFDTLSPMNEPGSAWWIYGNTQEGCHMSYDQQALIVNATASALKKVDSKRQSPPLRATRYSKLIKVLTTSSQLTLGLSLRMAMD